MRFGLEETNYSRLVHYCTTTSVLDGWVIKANRSYASATYSCWFVLVRENDSLSVPRTDNYSYYLIVVISYETNNG